jgi:NAD(P)-dependent dehydrogenase (short-subunit alcohol dehydrogenase family)
MSARLNDTALITGAASGIGAACARWLAKRGVSRLVLVDRDEEGLAALELSCDVDRRVGDVADEAFWTALEPDLGPLDHAVINAGIAAGAPLAEQSLDEWRRIMAVNLDGAFLTLRTSLRAMKGRKGSIVLVSSVAGVKPIPGIGAYGVSKAGVAHMARMAAAEYATSRIRINAIAPGGVDTPIWNSDPNFVAMVADMGREKAKQAMGAATPRGRFATAEEIATQVGFLLSDAALNITGAVLPSDGGYSL